MTFGAAGPFNRLVVLGAVLVAALAACHKSEESNPRGSAPAPSAPVAETPAAAWHYTIAPSSRASIDMPGVKEDITGQASVVEGKFDVVGADLGRSRGQVRVDLRSLATTTFHNGDDATQTRHARTWLEVQTGDQVNDEMRWAVFTVQSVDAPSASDLSKVDAIRDGADDVRKVTMTLRGELLVHGHAVPNEALVELAFHGPAGASSAAQPVRVSARSVKPMRVVLKAHDVKPRDPAGQLLAWTAQLLSKVAEYSDVSVSLDALPSGP